MPYGTGDLGFMFTDTVGTVPVVFGAQNARGQLQQVGENPEDPATPIVKTVLLMKTGAFGPAPAEEDQLTIDGATYKVRSIDLLEDGAVTAYTVSRTS